MSRQTTSLRFVSNNNDQCQISVTVPLFTLKIVSRQRAIAHRRAFADNAESWCAIKADYAKIR